MDVSWQLELSAEARKGLGRSERDVDLDLVLLLQRSTQRYLHHLLLRSLPIQVSSCTFSGFGKLPPLLRRSQPLGALPFSLCR